MKPIDNIHKPVRIDPELQYIIYKHKYELGLARSVSSTLTCALLVVVVAAGFRTDSWVDWVIALFLVIPIWQTTQTVNRFLNIRRKMITLNNMRE